MSGADAGKFDIGTIGALTFKAKPDFEAPTDANKNNVYEVTVRAADGDGNRGETAVKVTVENETGTVSLSWTQIRVGVPATASLSDPDGSVSGLTWQWYDAAGNEQNAEDANSDTYTPVADDVGDTLTAVASYTDGHGSGKSEGGSSVQCGSGGHPEQGTGVRRLGRRGPTACRTNRQQERWGRTQKRWRLMTP